MTELGPLGRGIADVFEQAARAGGVAIAMTDYDGPMPDAEFHLSLMRNMLETSGRVMDCVTFGTNDGQTGMMPANGVDVEQGLGILRVARKTGVVSRIIWLTVAVDTVSKEFDSREDAPQEMQRGDLSKMQEAGDPNVLDTLLVLTINMDGPISSVAQTYTQTPLGVVYGEVMDMPAWATLDGSLYDLMTSVVAA